MAQLRPEESMKKIIKFMLLLAVLCAPSGHTRAADNEFTIIAGDVLQITVWKEDQLNQEVLVLGDGTINYPLIGTVMAAGSTPEQLQDTIKDKLQKLIPDA